MNNNSCLLEISMAKRKTDPDVYIVEGQRFKWNKGCSTRPGSRLTRISAKPDIQWLIYKKLEGDFIMMLKIGMSGNPLVPNEKNLLKLPAEVVRKSIETATLIPMGS